LFWRERCIESRFGGGLRHNLLLSQSANLAGSGGDARRVVVLDGRL
jgi:hypothetical protein